MARNWMTDLKIRLFQGDTNTRKSGWFQGHFQSSCCFLKFDKTMTSLHNHYRNWCKMFSCRIVKTILSVYPKKCSIWMNFRTICSMEIVTQILLNFKVFLGFLQKITIFFDCPSSQKRIKKQNYLFTIRCLQDRVRYFGVKKVVSDERLLFPLYR